MMKSDYGHDLREEFDKDAMEDIARNCWKMAFLVANISNEDYIKFKNVAKAIEDLMQ